MLRAQNFSALFGILSAKRSKIHSQRDGHQQSCEKNKNKNKTNQKQKQKKQKTWFDHDFSISKSVETFLMSPCEIDIGIKLRNKILDNGLFIKASVKEKLGFDFFFYLNNYLQGSFP